jgi:hypothetical protein
MQTQWIDDDLFFRFVEKGEVLNVSQNAGGKIGLLGDEM